MKNKIVSALSGKKIIIPLVFVCSARVTYAFDYTFSTDEISAMSRILQTYALVSTVIVAVATIFIVFRNARKMKGGVFGKVLNYFGVGMSIVLLGYLVETHPTSIPMFSEVDANTLANVMFILGYILMAIAATKLSRAIEGNA